MWKISVISLGILVGEATHVRMVYRVLWFLKRCSVAYRIVPNAHYHIHESYDQWFSWIINVTLRVLKRLVAKHVFDKWHSVSGSGIHSVSSAEQKPGSVKMLLLYKICSYRNFSYFLYGYKFDRLNMSPCPKLLQVFWCKANDSCDSKPASFILEALLAPKQFRCSGAMQTILVTPKQRLLFKKCLDFSCVVVISISTN